MTTSDTFHARMMNIPVPGHFNTTEDQSAGLRITYKLGHRDARHAAAEIASEADAEIRRLVRAVDEERRTVAKMGHRLAEAHEECNLLRDQVCTFREQVDEANATIADMPRKALDNAASVGNFEPRSKKTAIKVEWVLPEGYKIRGGVVTAGDPETGEQQGEREVWSWHGRGETGDEDDWRSCLQAAWRHWAETNEDALAATTKADPVTTASDRQRFARAIKDARGWLRQHDGGEWCGWSCAVLTGTQEVSSPGWYALPPGQWCGEPHILIERAERDGMDLPTVAEAVDAWGVPVKVEE